MPRAMKFTPKSVLMYLQERTGQRFTPTQIANNFQRSNAEAREVLDDLHANELIRSGVDGTTRVFFVAAPGRSEPRPERIVGRGELKDWEAGLRRFEALCMTVSRPARTSVMRSYFTPWRPNGTTRAVLAPRALRRFGMRSARLLATMQTATRCAPQSPKER